MNTFTITEEERQFLVYVKVYEDIGYGRMMQIISNEWYRRLQREQPGSEGSVVVGRTGFALLPEREQRAFLEILEREEQQGMEY